MWERPFSIQKIILPIFGPCEKLQEMGEGIDRSQSVFYFVPQENSHSQAGSTSQDAYVGKKPEESWRGGK